VRRDSTEQEATMLDVLILFPRSAERDGLDDFVSRAVPLIKASPGIRSIRVNGGELMARGGPPPYSGVIAASFDSLTDWMALVDVLNSREDPAAFDRFEPLVMFYDARDG
jgi:hypothetical protein